MLGGFRSPYMKWAVFTSSEALTGAGTALAAGLAASLADGSVETVFAATVVGAFAAQLLDTFFASMTLYLRGTGKVRDYAQTLLPRRRRISSALHPGRGRPRHRIPGCFALDLPLFLTPALAAQRLFAMYQEQRRLAEDLSTANEALEQANLSFAAALVATLDARDKYTAGHSAAVAIYSRDIAARMGMSEAAQQEAHLAGLVHDIGKIGLPPDFLREKARLLLKNAGSCSSTPEIGEGILAKVVTYDRIAAIVRHHHERVDGHGYPDGLPEEEIPAISRIIAVADAYNAMTSDRPYREAMPSRVARMRLAQAVGSQFDTSVVAAFEAILATADEAYRLGMRSRFRFHRTARCCERRNSYRNRWRRLIIVRAIIVRAAKHE